MLLWAEKVSKAFADKIIWMASKLPATEPSWMMFGFSNESGFNPAAINSIGCVGIPQFCPDKAGLDYKTIGGVQYKLSDIRNMDALPQLDLTLQYFQDVQAAHGRFATYYDFLLADFWPAAIGQPDTYVFPQYVVDANKSLFKFGNTLLDYKKGRDERVLATVPKEYHQIFFEKKNFFQLYKKEIIFFGILFVLLVGAFLMYKYLFKK